MDIDFLIIGQGLAGTTLAWKLQQNGRRVMIVDRGETVTASRIAAGLLTPITGKRFVVTAGWSHYWPAAVDFYRTIEALTGTAFLHLGPSERWFADERERKTFIERMSNNKFGGIEVELLAAPPDEARSAPWGGFRMAPGGRLHVGDYLTASARHFIDRNALRIERVNVAEMQLTPQGVDLPGLDVQARVVVFCEGAAAIENPWFSNVDYRLAKGEILAVQIPARWTETQHQSVWLAPWQADLFRTGSTYEWRELDQQPTAAGRHDILHRLRNFVTTELHVVNHWAAVRPAVSDANPVIGRHPAYPQLAILNGLGAKGSLWAPHCADLLMQALLNDVPVPSFLNVGRWRTKPNNS